MEDGENVPDVIVSEAEGLSFDVELNMEKLPTSLKKNTYKTRVDAADLKVREVPETPGARIDAIDLQGMMSHHGACTLLHCASEIVRYQIDYFRFGYSHLRPMTLYVIADAISVHESTISRISRKSYINSRDGIVPLKYFFSSPLRSEDGDLLSN
jgi:RNA polymerase sigma-54 factor